MPYPTCNFVKADGVLCGSPALRGKRYCYFHTRQLSSARSAARARRRYDQRIALPPLDDRSTVIKLLSRNFFALASNEIDPKRAGAITSILRIATAELNRSEAARSRSETPVAPGTYGQDTERQELAQTCLYPSENEDL